MPTGGQKPWRQLATVDGHERRQKEMTERMAEIETEERDISEIDGRDTWKWEMAERYDSGR